MQKKLFALLISTLLIMPVYARTDKASCEYLKNKKHFSIINPFIENIAQRKIKKTLEKQLQGSVKVDFDGYTLSSLKQGVFKNLEIQGDNLIVEEIDIPYLKIKSITDYNRLDYTQKPIVFKSDMVYSYKINLFLSNIDIINQNVYHSI